MSFYQSAEENLRIIRSLMERTTTYRSISVPSAAWAGGLSVVALLINLAILALHHPFSPKDFLFLWLGVLAVAASANTILLYRDSLKTGCSFPSPAMLSALQGMIPAFFVAAVFTGIFTFQEIYSKVPYHWDVLEVPLWMVFYGLALLGTQHFAPRSIVIMGWAFLISALLLITLLPTLFFFLAGKTPSDPYEWLASALMASSFGGFHLIYSVAVHLSLRNQGGTP